jgi:hypothetical protein
MEMKFLIETLAVLMMLGGMGWILYGVMKGQLALNNRTIHFLTIAAVLPAIIVLAMEGRIGSEATGVIIGTIVGFTLANVSKSE